MSKRKKKWRRFSRNPGITVVFRAETREAVETQAAASGTAKATFIARLVEHVLGIADANARAVATATTAAVASNPQARLDEIWGEGVMRIVPKCEEESVTLPVIETVEQPETAYATPIDNEEYADEAARRRGDLGITVEDLVPKQSLVLPAESAAEPISSESPTLEKVSAPEPAPLSVELSEENVLDERARRFVQSGGSIPAGSGLIGGQS